MIYFQFNISSEAVAALEKVHGTKYRVGRISELVGKLSYLFAEKSDSNNHLNVTLINLKNTPGNSILPRFCFSNQCVCFLREIFRTLFTNVFPVIKVINKLENMPMGYNFVLLYYKTKKYVPITYNAGFIGFI